jgi:hypothetical protein
VKKMKFEIIPDQINQSIKKQSDSLAKENLVPQIVKSKVFALNTIKDFKSGIQLAFKTTRKEEDEVGGIYTIYPKKKREFISDLIQGANSGVDSNATIPYTFSSIGLFHTHIYYDENDPFFPSTDDIIQATYYKAKEILIGCVYPSGDYLYRMDMTQVFSPLICQFIATISQETTRIIHENYQEIYDNLCNLNGIENLPDLRQKLKILQEKYKALCMVQKANESPSFNELDLLKSLVNNMEEIHLD